MPHCTSALLATFATVVATGCHPRTPQPAVKPGSMSVASAHGDGSCTHTFTSPVLRITGVTDARTGKPIEEVALSDFTVNDVPLVAVDPLARAVQALNVTIRGKSLICRVECAFGTEEGRYSFIATANGYAPRRVEQFVRYRVVMPGCPYSSGGSTSISIAFEPGP